MAAVGSIFGGKNAIESAVHGDSLKYAIGTAGGIDKIQGESAGINTPDVDPDWINTRIKDLEKRSLGFLSSWEEREIDNERNTLNHHKFTQEIDNLKSVSAPGKFMMVQRYNEKRRRENFKKQALQEMQELVLSRNQISGFNRLNKMFEAKSAAAQTSQILYADKPSKG